MFDKLGIMLDSKDLGKNYSEIIIDEHYQGLNPMQFGHEKCAPGHCFGPAVRTHWLLHYVISGCGTFVKGGKTYRVVPGDTFVIEPYEETYYEADGDNPWHYIWIGFTGEPPYKLNMAVIHAPALGDIFTDALRCATMNRGRSAFLASVLWQIFACLLDEEHREYDYIKQAIHCMKLDYANGITVAEIADKLNLNRSYFSVLFKERTGLSPQDYLTNLRMETAKELMVKYKKTPSIAAFSTGYNDIYNFSRMFKRHTGMSPTAYIKQNTKG